MSAKKFVLFILYACTAVASGYLLVYGGSYYFQSLLDRPHHGLHDALKPGGFWGHGLGIIGTVMMLIMLLYLVRKYLRFAQKWGNIGLWLDLHIWLGITGPILVIFHTAFKFGGIVSISFWSMIAVAVSGIFGRYIYLQIPRHLSGEELTPEEIQKMDAALAEQVISLPEMAEPLLNHIQSLLHYSETTATGQLAEVRYWLLDSFRLRSQLSHLRRRLRSETKLNRYMISDLIRVIKERRLLNRRLIFLKAAHRILHHWHMVHRPFALVMYIIAFIHVLITTMLGYTWLF
ncbi:MAG: hypothetical protein NTW14_12415 [bacterium]|nr:hypothetical protein [bacterium]